MKLRPSTILLSGEADRQFEGIATAAITPGMLIEIVGPDDTPDTPGRAKDVAAHATAGGAGSMFAREMDLIGGSIEDDYEANDTVLYLSCRKGDRVFALLAAGNAVTAGDLLQSNGDGTLAAVAASSQDAEAPYAYTAGGTPVAVALEDIDNDPGTDSAAVRIKVEVL